MRADLHMHSTASDGQYSPAALVRLVKACGVQLMALTDHDTVDGVAAAQQEGCAQGLRVLAGVELSAAEHPNLHILGYGIDPQESGLSMLCAEQKQNREAHGQYIVAYLREKGVQIDLQEAVALAGSGRIGRPHFAQLMVRHGYVQTMREAFDRYLDTEEYHKTQRPRPKAASCIAAIRGAGGKAVLAHPYQMGWAEEVLEACVARLKTAGLAGIECYYPKHTAEQRAFYLRLAEKYGLHVTAGSDFHGEKVHPEDRIHPVELEAGWLLEGGEGV